MAKKVLINVEEREVRIAILEDDQLVELYIESLDNKTILNNIYRGRVEGIVAGLNAAFVNIGFERNAFLHFNDIRPDLLMTDESKKDMEKYEDECARVEKQLELYEDNEADAAESNGRCESTDRGNNDDNDRGGHSRHRSRRDRRSRKDRDNKRGQNGQSRPANRNEETNAAESQNRSRHNRNNNNDRADLDRIGNIADGNSIEEPDPELLGTREAMSYDNLAKDVNSNASSGRRSRNSRRNRSKSQNNNFTHNDSLIDPTKENIVGDDRDSQQDFFGNVNIPTEEELYVPEGFETDMNTTDNKKTKKKNTRWRGVRRNFRRKSASGLAVRKKDAEVAEDEDPTAKKAPAKKAAPKKATTKKAVADTTKAKKKSAATEEQESTKPVTAKKTTAKKSTAKKPTAKKVADAVEEPAVEKPATKKAAAKKAADIVEKPAVKKSAAKKPAAKKTADAVEETAVEKPAKKTPARKKVTDTEKKSTKTAAKKATTSKTPVSKKKQAEQEPATQVVPVLSSQAGSAVPETSAVSVSEVAEAPVSEQAPAAAIPAPEGPAEEQRPEAELTTEVPEEQPSEGDHRSFDRRKQGRRDHGDRAPRERKVKQFAPIAASEVSISLDDVKPVEGEAFEERKFSASIQHENAGWSRSSASAAISLTDVLGEKPRFPQRPHLNYLPVTQALKKGDEILVQVTKEEIGVKGARITTFVSLPGRYLVLMPNSDEDGAGGVSRKVNDFQERKRLKRVLRHIRHDINDRSVGVIVRTAGIDRDEGEIRGDADFLCSQWKEIQTAYDTAKAPALIYDDSDILHRLARDVFDDNIEDIEIDSAEEAEKLKIMLKRLIPSLVDRVRVYDKPLNIFHHYGVEKQIQKAGRRKVWLKSGGYLIIDEAEALTAIDVNSGKFVGKDDQEKMILKTNLEACRAIARELRLRDIGGIIVCDFIDMREARNRETLLNEFRNILRRDRARTNVSGISEFGLVEMTRKRVRRSLRRAIFTDCPYCQGAGVVLNDAQIWLHIKHDIVGVLNSKECPAKLEVLVHPKIKEYIDNNCHETIVEWKETFGTDVVINKNDQLHIEHYAINSENQGITADEAGEFNNAIEK